MKSIICLFAIVALSQGSKVDVDLMASLSSGPVDILVELTSTRFTLTSLEASMTKFTPMRATKVANALKEFSSASQNDTLAFLATAHKGQVKSFWINNMIWIEGASVELVTALSELPKVIRIFEDRIIRLQIDNVSEITYGRADPRAEWGIEMIRAEEAWAIAGGNAGAGAVVGIISTGCRQTHEALAGNYVGVRGWFDPYEGTPAPFDDNGLGTYVTGIIVGAMGIGVAPQAKWSSCRGLQTSGGGTMAGLISCGQFMACPTNPDGSEPDCEARPHIISNPWESYVGNFYDDVINAWKAAGIAPIFSAGNSGSNCFTVPPPADSDTAPISVGATDMNNGLAAYSSRGPTVSGRLSPDITAPGVNIRSAYHTTDNAYAMLSGTAPSCPHVAGLFALAHSVRPRNTWKENWEVIKSTAFRGMTGSGQICGGINDEEYPNNSFGWGRIDAYESILALIEI